MSDYDRAALDRAVDEWEAAGGREDDAESVAGLLREVTGRDVRVHHAVHRDIPEWSVSDRATGHLGPGSNGAWGRPWVRLIGGSGAWYRTLTDAIAAWVRDLAAAGVPVRAGERAEQRRLAAPGDVDARTDDGER